MIDPHFHQYLKEIGIITHYVKSFSYFGILILSTGVGYVLPVPERAFLILFGYAAKTENLNIFLVILASSFGSIAGDNVVYRLSLFGNRYVENFIQKVRSHKLIKYEHHIKDNIGKSIYFLRFVSGVRFFGPVISGSLAIRWKRFLPYNFGATVIHSIFFIMLGYLFHRCVLTVVAGSEVISNLLFFSSVFIVGLAMKKFSKK
jgi:membrane protein DedA with SNARE-associated domain